MNKSIPQNDPPVLLPDGRAFESWEIPRRWTRTYHVASDGSGAGDPDGSEARPFRTIQAAADVLKPGERVLIHAGTYREHVRPRRGGDGPNAMIGYHAAPGATVVLSGSERYDGPWKRSEHWGAPWQRRQAGPANTDAAPCWQARLPRQWFAGYLPFGMVNYPQHHYDNLDELENYSGQRLPLMLKRGLVFQNGERLKQVPSFQDLATRDGAYWCESNGLDIHVRPYGDRPPEQLTWAFTTREQAFAPEAYGLGYIHVHGLAIEHCADGFPWPQRAAFSAMHGTHWIIENCAFRQINALGVDLGRQHPVIEDHGGHGHHIVRHCTFEDIGICGLCGTAKPMSNLLIEDNLFQRIGFHDCERMWENAAVKFHWTRDCLFRRNLVRDTTGACGIWLDFGINNCRVTRNTFTAIRSIFGGVMIEAAKIGRTMVDHNIVIGTLKVAPASAAAGDEPIAGGHGLYQHDGDRIIFAHNLVLDCPGNGIWVRRGQVDRIAVGRGAVCRDHLVANNLITGCGVHVAFGRPYNHARGNLYGPFTDKVGWKIEEPTENLDFEGWRTFHGHDADGAEGDIAASFEPDRMLLRIEIKQPPPVASPVEGLLHDWHDAPRGELVIPGPFATLPDEMMELCVDPRRKPTGRE